MQDAPAYGTTRQRQVNVSYLEIERAALAVLASGQRPSVEILRKHLGRGSPATIAEALRRFWRDLGVRVAGDPAALTRLPAEIVDLTDGIWQKALALASQAAKIDDNAARERLAQLQLENEIRAQSFGVRERDLDIATRYREQALAEARAQVTSLLKELALDRETMRAQVARIIDLNAQVDDYRRQLALLVTRAVTRHRSLAKKPSKLKRRLVPVKRNTSKRKPNRRSR
jgi:Plasmid replication region DNA-binding N-term